MDVKELLRKSPPVDTSWTCRWYLLIMYLSVWLVGLGLTVIPGTAGVVAISVGATTMTLLTMLREGNGGCDV
jgi:hypothetical protein